MKPGVPQLVDFGGDDREQAFDLLREGFPSMPARVWQRGFERLAASPPPGGSGRLGQLLLIDGVPAGLVLEIASERDAGAMPRAIVNLSSWYVRPQARANALWMLKALTRRADVTYTDLSATAGVARMLPVLGFETISHQILCMPLVKLARRASTSARVLDE
ncbi:MAG: hypothetical protein R3E87_22695, partial [Burkholderiaceae bacterium]